MAILFPQNAGTGAVVVVLECKGIAEGSAGEEEPAYMAGAVVDGHVEVEGVGGGTAVGGAVGGAVCSRMVGLVFVIKKGVQGLFW